ncbi:MAG: hypothetical protein ACJAT2_001005 [Bacteriovoracaceae bacterium]|jgi:hypothetical protein
MISLSAFAGEAVVIVLETALYKEDDATSKVLQLARKNQTVWIHDREFGTSPLSPDYSSMNNATELQSIKNESFLDSQRKSGFFETMDRNGNTAFIKRSHVKLVYKDDREYLSNVNPFIEDPTDYRLEEPLPRNYPFTDVDKRRAFIQSVFGPALRSRYEYEGNIASTDRSFRKGIALGYAKKVSWDNENRFYLGGYGHILTSEANFTFSSGEHDFTREISYQVSLGPYLSYDVHRQEKWLINVGGGFNVNWNRHFVKLSNISLQDVTEERLFQGFSISPRIFSEFHWRDVLIEDLDLVFGIDMQFHSAQSYKAKSPPIEPDIWEYNDSLDHNVVTPSAGVLTFLVGIQSSY